MANGWIFPRLNAAVGGTGLAFTGPLRIVVHTTETLSDPRNWVPGWQYPSQVVADPKRRFAIQCADLNYAAKALYNEVGGVQTNTEGALQVEINWLSPDGSAGRPDLTDDDYRWLAREVFAPICRFAIEYGSPIDHTKVTYPGVIANSARADAPQRMAWAVWNDWNGWCGHRDVPENDHWDAGLLDLHKLARYTAEAMGQSPTTITEDDDDMPILVLTDAGTVYAVGGSTKREIIGAAKWSDTAYAIKHLVDKGVAAKYVTGVELGSLSIIPDAPKGNDAAVAAAAAAANNAAAAAAGANAKADALMAQLQTMKTTLAAVLAKVNMPPEMGTGVVTGPVDVSGTLDVVTHHDDSAT